jgi:hypothetical protein
MKHENILTIFYKINGAKPLERIFEICNNPKSGRKLAEHKYQIGGKQRNREY